MEIEASFFTKAIAKFSSRRLMLVEGRQLGSHTKQIDIEYEVLVPPGKSATHITQKVSELKNGGAAQDVFVSALKAEAGIEVDKSSITASDPTMVKAVMVVSSDGKLAEAPDSAPAAAPAPAPSSEEEGGNTGAIVGGVIGGLVGLLLVGGGLYYFLVVRKKSES